MRQTIASTERDGECMIEREIRRRRRDVAKTKNNRRGKKKNR
jgi:hypothetical protein